MTTTTENSVRTDIVAVLDGEATGAIVWWDLVDSVSRDRLLQAWTDMKLEPADVPATPKPALALGRACHKQAKKRTLVRPLEGQRGYSIVNEDAKGDTLSYQQNLNVTLDANAQLVAAPADHDLAGTVKNAFDVALQCLDAEDISMMLRELCRKLSAISLRASGGFYFIPPQSVDAFTRASTALAAASGCRCWQIPAMKTEGTVQAILNAVRAEAEGIIRELDDALDADVDGERALNSKVRRCQAAEQKVADYEALLGQRLEDIGSSLTHMRARITEAAMRKAAKAEAA